jgi:hypothetical protein
MWYGPELRNDAGALGNTAYNSDIYLETLQYMNSTGSIYITVTDDDGAGLTAGATKHGSESCAVSGGASYSKINAQTYSHTTDTP